jgi:hypothetical protein
MKKALSVAALVVALGTASIAAGSDENGQAHEFCFAQSELAEVVMQRRQEGIPMRKVMEKLSHVEVGDVQKGLTFAMVTDAYSRPLFNSSGNQQESINEFGSLIYRQCYRAFTK